MKTPIELKAMVNLDMRINSYNTTAEQIETEIEENKKNGYNNAINKLARSFMNNVKRRGEEWQAYRAYIIDHIKTLEPPYCDILYKKFIENKTYDLIAIECVYSREHIINHLTPKAIKLFRTKDIKKPPYLKGS